MSMLCIGYLLELMQEPGIDVGHLRELAHAHALRKRVADVLEPLGMRRHQSLGQDARLDVAGRRALPGLQRAHRFQQRLLKGAADRHDFAHGLHLRTERFVCARKLFELPLRNFDDHVVERRLEARRRLARDVVGDLVERVADRKLGRDLRDGESGRLRRQRRGARYARVHLDDDHAAVVRIDGKLDVRAAGLDADLADDSDGRVAHASGIRGR